MLSVTNLATYTVLCAVESITYHSKYITTPEFDKLTAQDFAARLAPANLASKSDMAYFVEKTDFDNKQKDVTSNKNELNELSKIVKSISTK